MARSAFLALVLGANTVWTAEQTWTAEADLVLAQADKHMQDLKWEVAIEHYRRLLTLVPEPTAFQGYIINNNLGWSLRHLNRCVAPSSTRFRIAAGVSRARGRLCPFTCCDATCHQRSATNALSLDARPQPRRGRALLRSRAQGVAAAPADGPRVRQPGQHLPRLAPPETGDPCLRSRAHAHGVAAG